MRRLNLKQLVAYAHQILGVVGQEDALFNLGFVSVGVVDGDLVRTGRHDHFTLAVFRQRDGQRLFHIALGINLAVLNDHVGEGGLTEELMHKAVCRAVVKLRRRADLHNVAHIHDHHAVGQRHGFGLIVRDEDDREVELLLQLLDLKAHGFAQLRVEVGKRLVQQHDLRVGDDGARQRDALLLSAGEVARIDLFHAVQTGVLERHLDALDHLRLRHLAHAQREGHVFKDVHVRPNREGLENHAQPALLRRHIQVFALDADGPAAQVDFAVAQIFKSGDHAQRGRLAAAAGPQEGEAFALFDGQVEIVDGGNRTQRFGGKLFGDMIQYDLIHLLHLLPVLQNRVDDRVADDNQHNRQRRERRGIHDIAVAAQGVDGYAERAGIRTIEQNGGRQLAHRRQEDQEEAGDHCRTNQRQGDIRQGFKVRRTAGTRCVFQRIVNLLQGGRGGLHREGEIACDVCDQNDPQGIVQVDAERAAPREDDADGQHDAGDGIRQDGDDLQHRLALRPDLLDDVGDHYAQEHGDQTGGDRQGQRVDHTVLDHLRLEEVDVVVKREVFRLERQTVGAEQTDKDDHHQRHNHDDDQRQQGDNQQGDLCAAQLDEHWTHGFALDDIVAARTQNDLLQPQRQHNHDDQQDGERRALANALERTACAGNQLVNSGRQGVDFLAEAEDGGNAEVGQRAGQNQQRARACGRQNQRHGDAADDVPLLGTGDTGGFFQRRIHALERGNHLHEHEREVIRAFHEDDAADGVDVERCFGQTECRHQPLIEIAGARGKQQLPCHRAEERREHIGDGEHRAHQPLEGDIASTEQPREKQTEDRAEQRDQQRDLDGVPHRGDVAGVENDLGEQACVKLAFVEERVVNDHHHRDDDDDDQNQEGKHSQHGVETEVIAIHTRHITAGATLAAHHAFASSS